MPKSAADTSSARNLILIMAAVVFFFVLATGISQYHLATIENHVRDSIGNALPSANRLSESRSHVAVALNAAIELSEKSQIPRAELRRQILRAEHEMQAAFRSYLALPQFPEEHVMADELKTKLDEFAKDLNDYADRVHINSSDQIRAEALDLDQRFRRIIEFELTHGERLSLNISALRFESLLLSIFLDAICVALAAAAAIVAVRSKSKSIKLLEERARELENFAFRVAHDLKNPLGVIKMSSELAESDDLKPETRDFIHKIRATSRRMTTMIDGLLDFARSGARPEPGAKSDVNTVLDSILLWAKPESESAGIQLQVHPVEGSVTAACSEAFLSSIISNLVRNALKYVRDGGNRPHTVAVKVTERMGRVRIEVADNGPGVATDKAEAIFEPYFRVSTKHQGIGLGLATVKRLVESHGGTVGLRSETGFGSQFWVELPRA